MTMEEDGKRSQRSEVRRVPPETEATMVEVGETQASLDPLEFFRPTNTHEAVATYTKFTALRSTSATVITTWASAVNMGILLWGLFPILTAGAFLFARQQPLYLSRLVFLALSTLLLVGGSNLVRAVLPRVSARHPLGEVLTSTLSARVGFGLLALGIILALFAPRWIGPGNIGLGLLSLVLAGASFAITLTIGAVPGEELLPAVALGPVLFFLALSTQTPPAPTHGKHVVQTSLTLMHSEWLLALAFMCLILAASVAVRLARPVAQTTLSTQALIGDPGMRTLCLFMLILAYVCAVGAGLARDVPHATVAVLLSLPMAVLPLTTLLRARTSAVLRVVFPQMQRTFLWFGVWLVGGLILGGAYLHLMTALHGIISTK